MSEDVLKKPVHLAILKPTHIQNLADAGKISASQFGIDPAPDPMALPRPPAEPKGVGKIAFPKVAHSDLLKKHKKQVHLQVLHNSIPPLPADKIPPCDTCKTAACCLAFVVNITKDEYESGLYGDAAVELTPEMYKQLSSLYLLPVMAAAPRINDKPSYFLEGKVGEPCPFLTADKRCGIYDIRPVTCRTYTCVGDARITEGMRQGTEEIGLLTRVSNAK
jgi:Fe-S-cluster containining protein